MKKEIGVAATCAVLCISGVLIYFFIDRTSPKAQEGTISTEGSIQGFPENDLAQLRDSGDRVQIRKHAWRLLEQLTQNMGTGKDKHPVWESWNTKCSTGPLSQYCKNPTSPETAAQQPNDGPPNQFSTVYYSTDLADWIRNNHLYDSNYLYQQLTAGATQHSDAGTPSNITPTAPDTSIAIKEIWVAVNPALDHSLNIPFYDPAHFSPQPTSLGDPYSVWPTLQLKLNQQDQALDLTTPCPFGATPIQTQDLKSPVPVDCFVYKYDSVKCANIITFRAGMKVPDHGGLSSGLPCVAVLVGVQIMTREYLPNWTWNTFWWTANPIPLAPDPVTGTYPDKSDGRPRDLGAGFHNFAMDTLLAKDMNPDQQVGLSPIFNPYLEGPMEHGPQSNCVQCHYQASYVPQSLPQSGSPGPANGLPNVDEGGLTSLIGPESRDIAQDCTRQQLTSPVQNHCRLRTSFLWSITTNQDPCSHDPFLMIAQLSRKKALASDAKTTGPTASKGSSGSPTAPCG